MLCRNFTGLRGKPRPLGRGCIARTALLYECVERLPDDFKNLIVEIAENSGSFVLVEQAMAANERAARFFFSHSERKHQLRRKGSMTVESEPTALEF
jgi:hypothetical protein